MVPISILQDFEIEILLSTNLFGEFLDLKVSSLEQLIMHYL